MKRALVVAAALVAAACSPPLVKLPTGTGLPVAPDVAAAALAQATMACRSLRTLTAEVAVSGATGGQRVRGRLSVGVAAPASARLEAVAPFGQPLFIFVASGNDATLLLPRDGRVLEHGQPDAVLEAVAGIPLGATDLETTLTGCTASSALSRESARQFGTSWLVADTAGGDTLYLRRTADSLPWSVVAIVHRPTGAALGWRAEYGDRQDAIPRSIRVTSLDDSGKTGRAFDVRLTLSQVEVDVPLGTEVFSVVVPSSAARMTLDELRRAGVVGGR